MAEIKKKIDAEIKINTIEMDKNKEEGYKREKGTGEAGTRRKMEKKGDKRKKERRDRDKEK